MFAHAFLSDITRNWAIPDNFAPWIKKICSVYVFNPRLHVHCCELTPSFECHWISDEAFLKEDAPEDMREKIYDYIMEGSRETPEVAYFHVGDIEKIVKDKHKYRNLKSGWESIDEATEYARCNSIF